MRSSHSLIIFIILLITPVNYALFDWLFPSTAKNTDDADGSGNSGESSLINDKNAISSAKFEMKSVDEKFLQTEAGKELATLSEQDLCHHKVVAQLKASCGRLTEEQIGKLGVLLLNCQSAAEGRTIYPCTDEMKIGECTKDMEQTVWNAYQIVSNRARAICFAVQQKQFRLKAEYTVNKLLYSTEHQLKAMDDIKDGQEAIHEAASDTLRRMFEGQQELMNRQESLKNSHNGIQTYIAENLKELTKEKAMIATGNKELAEMTDNIRKKIDEATNVLFQQESDQRDNHAEILRDLSTIREKAREVWEKIDNSSKNVLMYHHEAAEQYQKTLKNLQQVNATINFIMNTVTDMKSGIDSRLSWLISLIGGTEDKVTLLTVCGLHLVYFLLAAISVSFLQTPWFTRFILLIAVPLNAVSAVKNGVSLDFIAMTLFILLTSMVNYITCVAYTFITGLISRTAETKQTDQAHLCPCASPVQTVQFTNPEVESHQPVGNLSDRDLKKIATKLKLLMKTDLGRSSRESTPNLSVISTDSTTTGDNNIQTWLDKNFQDLDKHPDDVTTISATSQQQEELSVLDRTDSVIESVSAQKKDDVLDVTSLSETPPDVEHVKRRLLNQLDVSSTKSGKRGRSHSLTPRVRKSMDGSVASSRSVSRISSRASTPGGSRPQCAGLTASGNMCKLKSAEGSMFCHKHTAK
ncbi:protein brambleberry-like [Tubulanus polymorphus]|uniref:protein brambleberry-like n=1 Tax=Tubulanus polymorphus TaxID=672921 RepID=UPI003DA54077